MKKVIWRSMLLAGVATLSVPSVTFAQKEKDKNKKEMQTIVITRDVNSEEKTVIEIDGDKVKINGKDAKDTKDANVNVTTIRSAQSPNVVRMNNRAYGGANWDMRMDSLTTTMFTEQSNRAMLGVVTEGDDKGAEIKSVTKESGADKAGLKKGDILTKIGSKKIESTDDVTTAIRSHKPGDKVEINYLREGKEGKVTAELGKWKGITWENARVPMVTAPSVPMGSFENFNGSIYYPNGRPKLGLSIQDTDDGVGVKVLEVDEDSNAAKAGLKKDDIILGIDDKDIKSTDEISRVMRTAARDKYVFNFRIKRDGKNQNLEVKMPRKLKTADL